MLRRLKNFLPRMWVCSSTNSACATGSVASSVELHRITGLFRSLPTGISTNSLRRFKIAEVSCFAGIPSLKPVWEASRGLATSRAWPCATAANSRMFTQRSAGVVHRVLSGIVTLRFPSQGSYGAQKLINSRQRCLDHFANQAVAVTVNASPACIGSSRTRNYHS